MGINFLGLDLGMLYFLFELELKKFQFSHQSQPILLTLPIEVLLNRFFLFLDILNDSINT